MVDKQVVIDVSVTGVDEAERAFRRVHRAARGGIDWVYVAWLFMIVFFASFLGAGAARAEDLNDVRGTRHGCVDVTATGGWDTLTSASLENSTGSAVLSASLYWTEVLVKDGSATVYLCLAAAASCGAGTGNKLSVAAGSSITLPLRGITPSGSSGVQSIAVYAAAATTVQVCGFFRSAP